MRHKSKYRTGQKTILFNFQYCTIARGLGASERLIKSSRVFGITKKACPSDMLVTAGASKNLFERNVLVIL